MLELSRKMLELKRDTGKLPAKEEIYGLPVDTAVAFSNHKCIYKHSIERRQRNFLKKLGFLKPFLLPGEEILHVTIGCLPASFVEQLLTGVLLGPIKRTLLVVTDRRILHLPTTYSLSYRDSISQIRFADCQQIRISFSTMIARYKSGRIERFRCINRACRKKIKAILNTVSFEGKTSTALERVHICPRCTKLLINGCYICPNCSLKFKTHAWAATLSIIFPGGGYFYTRHPFLGLLEGTMELIFAFLFTVSIIVSLENYSQDPKYLGQAIFICALMIIYQKLATVLFSSKCVDEFIPKKRFVDVQSKKVDGDRTTASPQDMLASNWRSI
jgi:hypothetical protein